MKTSDGYLRLCERCEMFSCWESCPQTPALDLRLPSVPPLGFVASYVALHQLAASLWDGMKEK